MIAAFISRDVLRIFSCVFPAYFCYHCSISGIAGLFQRTVSVRWSHCECHRTSIFVFCGTNIEKPYKATRHPTHHTVPMTCLSYFFLFRALALFQIAIYLFSHIESWIRSIILINWLRSPPTQPMQWARTHFANKHSNISNLTTVASCPQHVESAAQTTMQSAPKAAQNAQIKLHRATFTNRIILFDSYFICILYR